MTGSIKAKLFPAIYFQQYKLRLGFAFCQANQRKPRNVHQKFGKVKELVKLNSSDKYYFEDIVWEELKTNREINILD